MWSEVASLEKCWGRDRTFERMLVTASQDGTMTGPRGLIEQVGALDPPA